MDHDHLMNVLVYVHFFDCKWIHIAILQKIADMIQNEEIKLWNIRTYYNSHEI